MLAQKDCVFAVRLNLNANIPLTRWTNRSPSENEPIIGLTRIASAISYTNLCCSLR